MTITSRVVTVVAALAAVGAIAFFALVDPAQCQWAPKCLFHSLTGWNCPGCGFSRAMHALLHGELAQALAYNYFMVLSVPYALAVFAVTYLPDMSRLSRFRDVVLSREAAYAYIVLFCIWWVVRNIIGI